MEKDDVETQVDDDGFGIDRLLLAEIFSRAVRGAKIPPVYPWLIIVNNDFGFAIQRLHTRSQLMQKATANG